MISPKLLKIHCFFFLLLIINNNNNNNYLQKMLKNIISNIFTTLCKSKFKILMLKNAFSPI